MAEDVNAVAGVRRVILENLAAVIVGPTMSDVQRAFRILFCAAFERLAEAYLSSGLSRDSEDHRFNLRSSIPLAACHLVSETIKAESLCPDHLRSHLLDVVAIVRWRTDQTQPQPAAVENEAAFALAAAVGSDLIRKIFEIEAAAIAAPVSAGHVPREQIAQARRERFQRFVLAKKREGVIAKPSSIYRTAGQRSTDWYGFLAGKHGPDSKIARAFDAVLGGRTPLRFFKK